MVGDVLLFVNTIFTIWCWRYATKCFEEQENKAGWSYIFLSALNGAAVASVIF